ncbi:venom toxin OcyC11 isoform X2 [Schistocerca gregaria]|uniref:venom toxin OcyC11 isoform X2 n=1 Tax=Schistocerca gregaria TaxID=7010 RepID=UPI00211F33BD|nr:venom toxin OcyC11 isoform X2 [Schistocerca gregaria]
MSTTTSLLTAFCVAVLLAAAYAAVNIEIVTESQHHPGQCFHSKTGNFYKNGEKWLVPGECVEYSCSFPHINGVGCGTVGTSPPCQVVKDTSKPYPECCPTVKCP